MKLVGGDSGRVEREEFVDAVRLAPSERVSVEVLFEAPGDVRLTHRTPDRRYGLGRVTVEDAVASPSFAEAFEALRVDPELATLRREIGPWLDALPDKTLAFVAEMDLGMPETPGPVVFTCPMHPEIVQDEPGRCPICGMKLVPSHLAAGASHDHHGQHEPHGEPTTDAQHGDHDGHSTPEHHGHHGTMSHDAEHHKMKEHGHHDHATADGIEWEDDMIAVNRITTANNTRWMLVDRETGARGHGIDWHFSVGDKVKIRLVNEMDSDHPMHHPFHIHGSGRFLVIARDGVTEPNLLWKDTVLVRTGETVDILLDVTNPGIWMAHCHIAEHHESGMMLSFTVAA